MDVDRFSPRDDQLEFCAAPGAAHPDRS